MKSLIRVFPTMAVLTAGLLISSCSSGSGSDENGAEIDGVQTEGQSEPSGESGGSGSPEKTPSDNGSRPDIVLPDDMNNIFEDIETGDETKDSIIADVVQRVNAIDMAIAESNPDLEALEFYSARDGLDSAAGYVRDAAESGEAGRTWTGTIVYYDFTVNNEGRRDREPIVSYCSDRSEAQTVELATGEILPGGGGGQIQFQVVVGQNDQGIWQVTRVLPRDEEGDQECTR